MAKVAVAMGDGMTFKVSAAQRQLLAVAVALLAIATVLWSEADPGPLAALVELKMPVLVGHHSLYPHAVCASFPKHDM